MSDIRTIEQTERVARKTYGCDHCFSTIHQGERYKYFRAWDPDRKRAGAKKWGAFVQERWHLSCLPPAKASMIRLHAPTSPTPIEEGL